MTTVLIVDDHASFRTVARAALAGRFTVVGEVSGAESGFVGEHAYLFPVVEVESHRLWRSREEIEPPPRPYFYDPWWGPWFYPHPWWRHPYWW